MIAFSLLALALLTLAGFVALHRAHKTAIDGYEDEFGFHPGVAPGTFQTAEIHEIHTKTGRAA
jgi:hypothetical protein